MVQILITEQDVVEGTPSLERDVKKGNVWGLIVRCGPTSKRPGRSGRARRTARSCFTRRDWRLA